MAHLKNLRAATPDEIAAIAPTSDLDANCVVLALDTPQGVATAVVRTAIQVDPIYYPEGLSTKYKLLFARDVENFLLAKGATRYFFDLHVSQTQFRSVVENFGAEPVCTEPVIKYRKSIG